MVRHLFRGNPDDKRLKQASHRELTHEIIRHIKLIIANTIQAQRALDADDKSRLMNIEFIRSRAAQALGLVIRWK